MLEYEDRPFLDADRNNQSCSGTISAMLVNVLERLSMLDLIVLGKWLEATRRP